MLVRVVRQVLEDSRTGSIQVADRGARDAVVAEVCRRSERDLLNGPRRVVNATGTILHTNFGRAPLCDSAVDAMRDASRYTDLDYDLETGARGSRQAHVEPLLKLLLGAEATMLVTSNAAALLLTLAATSSRREVIVSRGEAVEIGDGFRIPAIARQSQARLVEVGTTNRTTLGDYDDGIGARTSAILRVHTSNFLIVGFTEQPSQADLAILARDKGLLFLVDNGSGALVDTARFGLRHEPTPAEAIGDGADIVTFSTDKLLGGPQGGIIAGRTEVIDRIRKHPLARALRPDKTAVAALHATLLHYASGDTFSIPVVRMLGTTLDSLEARGQHLAATLRSGGWRVDVERSESVIGGGSLPGQTLPSVSLAVDGRERGQSLVRALRCLPAPVIARVRGNRVLLDLRTVNPGEETAIAQAFLTLTL